MDSACIRIFTEGDELYQEMYRAIDQAELEILLESYIFALDEIGNKFVEILNKKAGQGLVIKLHLDAVGSHYYQYGRHWTRLLHESITLKWFHRWSWRRPWQFNVRNHRKLLVVDRCKVFIGGFNIHEYSSLQCYGEGRWRDTHMVLQSDSAALVARYFDDLWSKRTQVFYDEFRNISFVPNFSRKCRYLLRCQISRLINNARNSIQVSTPYFVPDEYLVKALIKAVRRGVEVSLLVPCKGDHPLVSAMAWRYYARLVQDGIKVFAYLPRMMHAKTMVVDSRIVIIGSANMDYRSFFVNHELVCLFISCDIAIELSDQFGNDCKLAETVALTTSHALRWWWLRRPIAGLLKHWI